MAKRRKPGLVAENSEIYQALKQRLHTSSIPESLPCRENEFSDIHHFLETKLKEKVGGCMYISGVPGTGKTATVHEVIRTLQAEVARTAKSKKQRKKDSNISDFTFVELNGLRLTDPYQAYTHIYQELTKERVPSKTAAALLSDYFIGGDEFVVLLVDELDVLCTKKQTILYHLFDWPNRPNSNLVVIAIANAMDLPERVMMSRIASRLGLTRLTFQPYTHKELQDIVLSRLDGLQAFDADAIQLVARKVAAVSGDARRALDICRRAALISENTDECSGSRSATNVMISMKDVDKALQEMFSSTKLVAVREASEQEQILLKAIIQEFRVSGLEEAEFARVYDHHSAMCKFDRTIGWCPSTSELFEIAGNLYDLRLILLDANNCYLRKKIRLNISQDDVEFALNSAN
ncbi:Origin recognition complex subunit 1 [Halotydeus destructor]|nr:Origin recognition complex subunit 1 [Halotydeus destructor]